MHGHALRALRAAAATLALLALLAPAAQAHAEWSKGTESPSAGSRLAAMPAEVTMRLTEPLDPGGSMLRVTRADGVRVDTGPTRFEDADSASPRMSVSLRQDAGPGAYTVTVITWSTADTHTWTGSYGFAVGDFEPPATVLPASKVPLDAAVGRFLAFAGLALGFGAALFLLWMPGADARWPARYVHEPLVAAGVLHTAGLAILVHATKADSGLGFAAFAGSTVGRLLLVRLLLGAGALLLALLALPRRTRTLLGPPLASLLLLLAGLATSRLGHASVHGVAGVAVDFMHLLAAATWAGGLAVLLWVLSNAAGHLTVQEVRRIGLRFGTAALVCVVVLSAAGLAATALIVGPRLWTAPLSALASPWGAFLAAKVGLTALMLASAAANRLVFLEPPRDIGLAGLVQRLAGKAWGGLRSLDAVADARGLRRVVAVEALLGVAVLAAAGALTTVSPPAEAALAGGTYAVAGSGPTYHAELRLTPSPVLGGDSDAVVAVADHAGNPVDRDTCGRTGCLSLTVTYAGAPAGESHTLRPDGEGNWTVGLLWTQAGNATLALKVQTAEVFEETIELPIAVRAAAA